MQQIEYFTGKVRYAQTAQVDKYGRYGVNLILNAADIDKYKASGIQRQIKQTDQGPSVEFSRYPAKISRDGKPMQFGPVRIVDKNGEETDLHPQKEDEVVCKVTVYDTEKGKGCILEAIQLKNKEGKADSDERLF
jgi:hypothetical protein